MSKEKQEVRVYLVDKPSFLSCGKAYVTNKDNRIILCDEGNSRLVFRKSHDVPYCLALYPIKPDNEQIRVGRRVYPFRLVDMPADDIPPKKREIPKVLEMILISQRELDELDRGLALYRKQVNDQMAKIQSEYRENTKKYRVQIKRLEAKITEAQSEIRKKHPMPDLAQLILENFKR